MAATISYLPGIVITLTDNTRWIDESNWTPVSQATDRALSGTFIVENFWPNKEGGRPITLNIDWIDRDTITLLEEMRDRLDQTEPMALVLVDGRTFNVILNHQEGPPLFYKEVTENPDTYSEDRKNDYFNATLKLLEKDAE